MKTELLERWTVKDSSELYGVQEWGAGYFDISDKGHVVVFPRGKGKGKEGISLLDVISGLDARGLAMPVLLRVGDILDSQIAVLHESFRSAIKKCGYNGQYMGVYPIKVNQQQQVVEEVTHFGSKYHHGLEAGSKAELIVAMSMLKDPDACLICNGYKDQEFVDLGLYARKIGMRCFFVIEMPSEVKLILDRAEKLGIKPLLGVRMKLASRAGGHWTESGGDRSVFGLSTSDLIDVVDNLKSRSMLDCLELLHYHLGSQIPNIRDIRSAAVEASRVYVGLVQEGAPMGYLDMGGGLAVDYVGSHTNFTSSRNYTLDEYCEDLIEVVMATADSKGVPHPNIITESGRATVAYYSILLFNILDVSKFETKPVPIEAPEGSNEVIRNMVEVNKSLKLQNMQECLNDAIYYRDELRVKFKNGDVGLRERALGENIFWHIVSTISRDVKKLKSIPEELAAIEESITADIYYGNFSLFQSLPDSWAIEQLFPIMPVHRLDEAPRRNSIIADITCDCDGKIDKFIDLHDMKRSIRLHELKAGEDYYLGVFLVGAYQETLGDLHNLFGDTNVATIRLGENGSFEFVREIEGDTVADILSYVEYDPKVMVKVFREKAEQAVQAGLITPKERRAITDAYDNGMRGYTYLES